MNNAEINALLAAVRYGNLTTAAEKLYISQPALSRSIQSLEKELGFQLLRRGKGLRAVTLTTQGERFVELAEQWSKLWEEMQAISDNSSGHILHFSAINSLVNYVIYPSINSFMQTHPAVHLSVESQHSYTAIGRVLSGILDGAFICNITVTRGLHVQPLWEEEMCLVAGHEVATSEHMTPDQLDVRNEIRIPWNNEFDEWHNYWYGTKSVPLITIDHMTALERLMVNKRLWMVAPYSAAFQIAASTGAKLLPITPHPQRCVYFITPPSSVSKPMQEFVDHTLQYVSQFEGVRLQTPSSI